MAAYYNEIDPFAAAWLRELIAAGLIAPGDVDERSIEDVCADDLAGYDQCHFFAGIGGWSYALRLAGWPDDRPVWTGSCPCQPFSSAGKRRGFDDARHLWPAFFRHIERRRPHLVLGEQVSGPHGRAWYDVVRAQMEAVGYACGALDTPAASVGAPHIRQRLWWCGMADPMRQEWTWRVSPGGKTFQPTIGSEDDGGLVYPDRDGRGAGNGHHPPLGHRHTAGATGEPRGFWAEHEWRWCRDGKWRPIEPGLEPLAHGLPGRVAIVCPYCKTETMIYEGMYVLRKINGGNERSEQEKVLRDRALSFVSTVNACNKQNIRSSYSEEEEESTMRNLWEHEKVACTPQRQGLLQQQPRQPTDALFYMPSQSTCVEQAVNVRSLWKDFQSGVTQERKQNMFCPVCERVGPHLCKPEMVKNRVNVLRGIGNAIVPQQAAAFIQAVMEEI